MNDSTDARLRRVPPGTTSWRTKSQASSSTGTASASTRTPIATRAEHLGQMSEQPEARDVSRGVDRAAGNHGLAGHPVERRHHVHRAREWSPQARPRLMAVVKMPMPSGLVSSSASPGRAPTLRTICAG